MLTAASKGVFTADELFNSSNKLSTKKNKKNKNVEPEEPFSFKDKRLIPVYRQAWQGSQKPFWLINAAVIYMLNGAYGEAAQLYPESVSSRHDALFWGIVFYDGANYTGAVNVLSPGASLEGTDDELISCQALLSDAYIMLDAEEEAEAVRKVILDYKTSPQENSAEWDRLYPVVAVNSALYMRDHNDAAEECRILTDTLEKYPAFEPALASYGELSLACLKQPEEDEISQSIRKAGLKTLGMEKYDRLPKITTEDALAKIDNAIEKEKNPKLIVLREKLKTETAYGTSARELSSVVWKILEENRTGVNAYPPEIVQWAVSLLLNCGSVTDARELFFASMQTIHSKDGEPFDCAEHPEELLLWECEYAAWFYADSSDMDRAKRLYSYITEEFGPHTPATKNSWNNSAVVNSFANLGVIYASTGKDGEALYVLNQASARAADAHVKAEILYRMASLQEGQNDDRSAIRSLQYALTLNPDHNRSRLLLKRIRAK